MKYLGAALLVVAACMPTCAWIVDPAALHPGVATTAVGLGILGALLVGDDE
jgi:hypothetical protein